MSLVLDDAKAKVQFRPTLMDLRNLVSQVIGQSITVIQASLCCLFFPAFSILCNHGNDD
jgi:DNA-binding SARP family transcriptional activator